MAYRKIEKYDDKSGKEYWGTGRIEKMVREKELTSERGALVLMSKIASEVKSVVDLGCGIGRRHIHFPGFKYVGIDREKVMIDKGKEVFPELELYRCDLMEVADKFSQFKEAFDMAFTFHVVQYNHSTQQQEIFKNIYEVIKPGGYYYMKENENDCPRESVPKDLFEEVWISKPDGHTIFRKK